MARRSGRRSVEPYYRNGGVRVRGYSAEPRKVKPREFFIHRFGKDPSNPYEKRYFGEWKQRFASGQPEAYMDDKSKTVFKQLQQKKMKYPTGWKGKGGSYSAYHPKGEHIVIRRLK